MKKLIFITCLFQVLSLGNAAFALNDTPIAPPNTLPTLSPPSSPSEGGTINSELKKERRIKPGVTQLQSEKIKHVKPGNMAPMKQVKQIRPKTQTPKKNVPGQKIAPTQKIAVPAPNPQHK
jgi:hypothetical protein